MKSPTLLLLAALSLALAPTAMADVSVSTTPGAWLACGGTPAVTVPAPVNADACVYVGDGEGWVTVSSDACPPDLYCGPHGVVWGST